MLSTVTYPYKCRPTTTTILTSSHPPCSRDRSTETNAQHLASPRSTRRPPDEGGCFPPRRCLEHATSTHRWRHDRRSQRRCHTRGATAQSKESERLGRGIRCFA